MIRHVVILLLSGLAITVTAEEKKKFFKHDNPLTLEDPIEAWFPELEYEERDQEEIQRYVEETDKSKKLDKFNGAAGLWEKYKANLTPQRKYEYLMHMALRYEITHGPKVRQAKECEAKFNRPEDHTWDEDQVFVYQSIENLPGVMWINQERYMKYVYGRPDQKWLLMWVRSPFGKPKEWNFQTHEVLMARMYCFAQSEGANLGFVDVDDSEMLVEAFNYKTVDYGFLVPYYVMSSGGKACHLEQKIYSQSSISESMQNCTDGLGMRMESMPYPRNQYNIYWEYIKKDIGVWTSHHLSMGVFRYFGWSRAHWSYDMWMDWFGIYTHGEKQAGKRAMLMLYLPLLLLTYEILKFLTSCCCGICCAKPQTNESKEKKPAAVPVTATKSKHRVKME